MKSKQVTFRCIDNAEALVFNKYEYKDFDIDYEINIEDSYCGGDYMGIKGRFKRAWHAFLAKPIHYTGVYSDNVEDIKKWLTDCLALIEETE